MSRLVPEMPVRLWDAFTGQADLPAVRYAIQASAVYSSMIEGNTLDLNGYMRSKIRGGTGPKAEEQREIDDLVDAYEFARGHALNEKNLLKSHEILSSSILPMFGQGKYRTGRIFVYDSRGFVYAPIEAEHVPEEMHRFFLDVRELRRMEVTTDQIFYHPALMHLVFVHIHPFVDGNGRTALLLEKWFLASKLGTKAWKIPSDEYYWKHRPDYYKSIHLGPNFYELDYDEGGPDGCTAFLELLPNAMKM